MDKRILAVLAITGILLAATVTSALFAYDPSFDDKSSSMLKSAVHIPDFVDVNNNRVEDWRKKLSRVRLTETEASL